MTSKNTSSSSPLKDDSSAWALLKAATQLFSKKGFDGVTLKEISELAGVNISLVSYHFDGKEGLYRACLERHGQHFLTVIERVFRAPQTAEEFKLRLEMFVEEFFRAVLEEPDQMRIVRRECDYEFLGNEEIFESMYLKLFSKLVEYFRQAQKAEILRSDLDPQLMAMNFFGGMKVYTEMEILMNRFLKLSLKEPKTLKKVMDHILKIFFNGILEKEKK